MTQFITKLASSLAVLALVASVVPAAAHAEVTPSITTQEFITVDGRYKGISVGFETHGITDAESVSVTLTRASGGSVTKTGSIGVLNIVNADNSETLTTPFVIMEGDFKEANDTHYWNPAPSYWDVSTRPESVTITIRSTSLGDITATNPIFNEGGSWPTYESIVPTVNTENFNTVSNAGYKGINVGFNVANIDKFDEVTVSLLGQGDKVLVVNEGVVGELENHLTNGVAKLSTPFITQDLGYAASETHWTFGKWSSYEKPLKAVIEVNGVKATNSDLDEQHDWATLIPQIIPENFNTHAGADYEGINVGFDVANFNEFESVTVELQDANGNTLAVNEGVVSELNTLLNGGAGEFSTPFITKNLTYGEEAFWTLGEWQSAALPAKAIITINGIVVAENETLSIQHDWTTIAPVIEEEEEEVEEPRRRSGGSRRVVDSTPAGEVLGVQTGPVGQVLGASTYVFTRDLTIGSRGDDVVALQAMLIASGDLAIAAPTGYFGPLTQAALAKWQAAHGVAPAAGYFGPITRAAIAAAGTPVMTAEARAALIANLLAQVAALQAQLDAMN